MHKHHLDRSRLMGLSGSGFIGFRVYRFQGFGTTGFIGFIGFTGFIGFIGFIGFTGLQGLQGLGFWVCGLPGVGCRVYEFQELEDLKCRCKVSCGLVYVGVQGTLIQLSKRMFHDYGGSMNRTLTASTETPSSHLQHPPPTHSSPPLGAVGRKPQKP